MPSKNILKQYVENGCYHVYNRGVEKRLIFTSSIDYKVFIYFLKIYLTDKEKLLYEIQHNDRLRKSQKEEKIRRIMPLCNFSGKIHLVSFVCMPNHFHLQLIQDEKLTITHFMQSLMTKYTRYFNNTHRRVGPLFQSRYKAVHIGRDEYFIHISRYIHKNPFELLKQSVPLHTYPWSSYPGYVTGNGFSWLDEESLLSYFGDKEEAARQKYQQFVEESEANEPHHKQVYLDLLLDRSE